MNTTSASSEPLYFCQNNASVVVVFISSGLIKKNTKANSAATKQSRDAESEIKISPVVRGLRH